MAAGRAQAWLMVTGGTDHGGKRNSNDHMALTRLRQQGLDDPEDQE